MLPSAFDRVLNQGIAVFGRTALLAVVLLLSSSVPSAHAQDRTSSAERYTMAWRGVQLDEALRQFREVTRLDISWDPLLTEGKRAFCVAEQQTAENILVCLLQGTGLDFIRRSSGLYVLSVATEGPGLYGNLRGIVLDGETEQPLSHAHVLIAEAGRNSIANLDGLFIFPRLLAGEYRVRVSHLGYRTQEKSVTIAAGTSESVEIILQAGEPLLISQIVVDGIGMMPSSTLLGAPQAAMEDVINELEAGTQGLIRSLDALPGVRVNDATADVHIQGGEAGEHQFRLDGAPVFLPLNVASFIGPFSPFALGKITVNKAGFGAPLGSQISGVIAAEHDLRAPSNPVSTNGSNSQYTVQVDPLSTNARHTGFWIRPSGVRITTLGAARIGTWRLLAPPSLARLMDDWNVIDTFLLSAFAEQNTPFANLPSSGEPTIQFTDLHAATKIQNGLQTITASSYWGRSSLGNSLADINLLEDSPSDVVRNRFRDLYSWQNGVTQFRVSDVRSARVLTSWGARGSFYQLRHDFDARDAATAASTEDDGNRVTEMAVDGTWSYFPANAHEIELGGELVVTASRFTVAGTQQIPLIHESAGWRIGTYVQDRFRIGDHAAIEAGSRFTWLHARTSLYAEPRLSARFDWTDTPVGGFSLYAGTGLYRQFVSQFDISSRSPRTFVSSTRFWMSNDHSVTPPKAAHAAVEMLILPNNRWTLTLESFYKKQYHILSVDYAAETESDRDLDQDDFLSPTKGYSYGFSGSLKRRIGPGNVRIRMDHTQTRRRIRNMFDDEWLSVPWNEPLRLELSADLSPIPRSVLLARWRSVWGREWGFRKAYYDFLSANLNDVGSLLDQMRANGVSADAIRRVERQISNYDLTNPTSHQLPAIHQLDLSAAYSMRLGVYSLQLRADLVNVLGRRNTAEWRFQMDEETYFGGGGLPSTGLLERSDRLLLPRILSFAARLTW
ncbi:MAG: TonB-dependent receptor [Bacteroidetes bacterium]|nr:TonB-dependent receptor [Bacteroidota bacterium]